ncbi:NAD(P)/FAD-dependent oxidoreductase [Nocardia sp. BMG51109]|uniref:FAD-dependent oxidoreductase n=1 Tax=Nocardia sp. BMG51109 TaxID=1056816 RepID=UPI0004656F8B|nr:FAD-dependent monooxygenase [Nocardia sp. BMG51109]
MTPGRTRGNARRRAVVIGAGLTGCLAAHVVARHVDDVILVESDTIPETAESRGGVPQDRLPHMLLPGGQRALQQLLPGIVEELVDAGAVTVGLPSGIRILTTAGWLTATPADRTLLTCTRPLIDWTVRRRVLTDPRITIRQSTVVTGLLGTSTAVRGVRTRGRGAARDRAAGELAADFVLDASGRRSRAPDWLTRLGLPPTAADCVDSGVAYTARMYTRPAGAEADAVLLQPKSEETTRCGLLLPVEGDRWMIGLCGMRNDEPPTSEEGYLGFMDQLRDPLLGRLAGTARPLGRISGFRPRPSRRLRFERSSRWPDGFVVLGDAVCTFNPIYGQGMSVAAANVLALRTVLAAHGLDAGAAFAAQRAVAKTADAAWQLASLEDARYEHTTGGPGGPLVRLQHRLLDRLAARACRDADVAGRYIDVISLTAPPTALLTPKILARALCSTAAT